MRARSSIISFHAKVLSDVGAALGGIARSKQLAQAHITRIAKHAANTRWGNPSKYKNA